MVLQAEPLPDQGPITLEQVESARRIVEGRLAEVGIANAVVRTRDNDRVIIELSDTADIDMEELTRLVTERGLLEFIDSGTEPLAPGTIVATELGPPDRETPTTAQVWEVVVSNHDIDGGSVQLISEEGQFPEVYFALKDDGAKKMEEFTSRNIGHYIPIVFDKTVISSPVIQGVVTNEGVITGFSEEEAKRVVAQLKHGPLPVKLQLLEIITTPTPSNT